jgi:hypothetical protein
VCAYPHNNDVAGSRAELACQRGHLRSSGGQRNATMEKIKKITSILIKIACIWTFNGITLAE